MRRFTAKYTNPKSFNLRDIERDTLLVQTYGLRNKKQLRRAKYLYSSWRSVFRRYTLSSKVTKDVCEKLYALGVIDSPTPSSETYLSLTLERILDRRLQTLVAKQINSTLFKSRSLITQGHVSINSVKKRFPSYLVRTANEAKILLE